MAIIHALSRWVDPNDKTSLYGRLYHLWQSVQRIARTEPTSSRVLWRDSDQQLALSWAFMDERLFSLKYQMHSIPGGGGVESCLPGAFPTGYMEPLSFCTFD